MPSSGTVATDEDHGRRRPIQSCQACRIRHLKCDFEQQICRQCKAIGLECVRQNSFKFRFDPKQKLVAETKNTWIKSQRPITFLDETHELRSYYEAEEIRSLPQNSICSDANDEAALPSNEASRVYNLGTHDQPPEENASLDDTTYGFQAVLTTSEAILIRNYVDNMALWTDICDPAKTFEFEVPRRALTEPILKHALCSFSARHLHRDTNLGETEALYHQDQCLRMLIPAMSERTIDETTLMVVAILRQNEEMDEHDNRFHLDGVSRILNAVPNFAAVGGLGEAAAWLCLREDIYVSLTTQSPIKIALEHFRRSSFIERGDDASWASLMVLHLAELLKEIYSATQDIDKIASIDAEIAAWESNKPTSFQPIYYRARRSDDDGALPDLWMLAGHHAIGVQYYHIAQIVLDWNRLSADGLASESTHEKHACEQRVRYHLLIVIGVANSNERVENVWFTARHCISVWGVYLRNDQDRQACVGFLQEMGRRTGWKIDALVQALRSQWQRCDGGNDRNS
ncbi:hypothetical protein HII31_07757 [Pseudocercospora fuligena]|uniref:Zn(2)-C6 fungal-type domain-containing protein n=1 Tax=Pseudocercospora fuligena TaxID=685502 RepID=A0A8H6RGR0_9PEZI|nr:hypothetical protein HII31_07757 [Pseudocercospora fuligena]